MGTAKNLIELRNAIDDLVNQYFQVNEGAILSTDEVLMKVKSNLQIQIKIAISDLIDIALKRLIDGVGRRKAGRRGGLIERDLFGAYPNIPQTVTIGEKRRKRTSRLSIGEALNYLKTHSPRAVSERYNSFKRLVDDCLPFRISDDDTIEELIARREQSRAVETKSAFGWTSSSTTVPASQKSVEESVYVL